VVDLRTLSAAEFGDGERQVPVPSERALSLAECEAEAAALQAQLEQLEQSLSASLSRIDQLRQASAAAHAQLEQLLQATTASHVELAIPPSPGSDPLSGPRRHPAPMTLRPGVSLPGSARQPVLGNAGRSARGIFPFPTLSRIRRWW
jgi:hypothetical protein